MLTILLNLRLCHIIFMQVQGKYIMLTILLDLRQCHIIFMQVWGQVYYAHNPPEFTVVSYNIYAGSG